MNKKYLIFFATLIVFLGLVIGTALMVYRFNQKTVLLPPVSVVVTPPISGNKITGSGLVRTAEPIVSLRPSPVVVASPASKTTSAATGCGIIFTADSNIQPTKCELKNVTPGEPCGEPGNYAACPPSYQLEISGRSGGVQKIYITSFKLRNGRFTYGDTSAKDSFIASMVDSGYHTSNLKTGEMTLNLSSKTAKATLNLLFANGKRISGAGEVPIVEEILP